MRIAGLLLAVLCLAEWCFSQQPAPPGKMVRVGAHQIHVYCTGQGKPTVVVEVGLGDFSFDWILVQNAVSSTTRICTYDRAGYAWSGLGPVPRTYPQVNLELREALRQAGESGPYVLVGHSFGGGLVRSFAARYPDLVAGMVLVDAVQEDQIIQMGEKVAARVRDSATGKAIPEPDLLGPIPSVPAGAGIRGDLPTKLPPDYDPLPEKYRKVQLWAQFLPELEVAESSQLEWSPESMALMHSTPQEGILGDIPLIVLSRKVPGYPEGLNIPAAELDRNYVAAQDALARLSHNSLHRLIASGHNMNFEAPDEVSKAILEVVLAVRGGTPLK